MTLKRPTMDRYDEVAVIRPDDTTGPTPEECLTECREHVVALETMLAAQRERIGVLQTQLQEIQDRELVHEIQAILLGPTTKLVAPALERLSNSELVQLLEDGSALVRRVAAEHVRRCGQVVGDAPEPKA